jgi:hypothetical protein
MPELFGRVTSQHNFLVLYAWSRGTLPALARCQAEALARTDGACAPAARPAASSAQRVPGIPARSVWAALPLPSLIKVPSLRARHNSGFSNLSPTLSKSASGGPGLANSDSDAESLALLTMTVLVTGCTDYQLLDSNSFLDWDS